MFAKYIFIYYFCTRFYNQRICIIINYLNFDFMDFSNFGFEPVKVCGLTPHYEVYVNDTLFAKVPKGNLESFLMSVFVVHPKVTLSFGDLSTLDSNVE